MLAYKTQLLRAVHPQISRPRLQTFFRLNALAHRDYSQGSTDNERHNITPSELDHLARKYKVPRQTLQAFLELSPRSRDIVIQKLKDARSKRRLPRKYKFIAWLAGLYATARLVSYACEPPQDPDLSDLIADETVIPPKQAETPCFPYRPITGEKEIRLLVLEPGTGDTKISCRLMHVQDSCRATYEALSYAWGDSSNPQEILCSGTTKTVRANLHNALKDLRHPTRERVLWTDSLCINQDDNEEKTKQVRLMREIYTHARQVLIYLGKADPSVDRAIECICKLDQGFKWAYVFNNFGLGFWPGPVNENEVNWDQVINLLRRPWFSRTWIIQETVLAQNALVICGKQSIPWAKLERVVLGMEEYRNKAKAIPEYKLIEDVVAAVHLIASARLILHPPAPSLSTWIQNHIRNGPPAPTAADDDPKLLDLVLESRTSDCERPCDKIFGMLGMTGQDTMHKHVKPDYAISAEEAYKNFALCDILHNGSLRVLGVSSDKAYGQHLSPSWVPRFDRLDPHHILTGRHNLDKFDASAGSSPQARVTDSDSVLHLKGRIVDVIDTVGQQSVNVPPVLGMHETEERFGNTPEWYLSFQVNKKMIEEARDIWIAATARATKGLGPIPKASEILPLLKEGQKYDSWYDAYAPPNWEPFLRTLVCDRGWLGPQYRKNPDGSSSTRVASFVRVALQGTDLPRWFRKHDGVGAGMAQQDFLHVARSRHFAGTDKGLIGWVPMRAKKGDVVCVLYGADVPIVLKKAAGGKYVLVGECYMHGIMYGEALKATDDKSEDVEFTIV